MPLARFPQYKGEYFAVMKRDCTSHGRRLGPAGNIPPSPPRARDYYQRTAVPRASTRIITENIGWGKLNICAAVDEIFHVGRPRMEFNFLFILGIVYIQYTENTYRTNVLTLTGNQFQSAYPYKLYFDWINIFTELRDFQTYI